MSEYLFVSNQHIPTSTVVLPRTIALSIPFDENLTVLEDKDIYLRLAKAGLLFRMIERPLTIVTDRSDDNRLSRQRDHHTLALWFSQSRHLLTPRAAHGFRATVLASMVAANQPATAMRYLLEGWSLGRLGAPLILRQAARCFLPSSRYRRLVDAFVATFGRRPR